MTDNDESDFVLDRRIAWESEHVLWLELCELRLINDCRWPWLLLIPQRAGLEEIHDLEALDQTMLALETSLAASTLKAMTGCKKINTGALGNMVPQLHMHVIARNEDDEGWPGPVWGHGTRIPYGADVLATMIETLRTAFDQATAQNGDDE